MANRRQGRRLTTKAKPVAARGKRRLAPVAAGPLISAVIFDLDDTLYDCFRQRVRAAHFRASQAMVEAGVPGTAVQIFRARMKAFKVDPQLSYIDAEVCRQFGVADAASVTHAARHAFFTLPVTRLKLFPGTRGTLRALKRCGVKIFVVSFGELETQRAKIPALGLDREPSIDGIYVAEYSGSVTKHDIFRAILRKTGVDTSHVLVVGDRPSSEIRAGKELGMRTVRLRGGEFRSLEPRGANEQAEYEIRRIEQVLKLPFLFGEKAPSRNRRG